MEDECLQDKVKNLVTSIAKSWGNINGQELREPMYLEDKDWDAGCIYKVFVCVCVVCIVYV